MRDERVGFEAGDGERDGPSRGNRSEFRIDLGAVDALSATYRHQDTLLTSRAPLILPGAFLKWFELRRVGELIPERLVSEAQSVLSEAITDKSISIDYGVGIVVLHYAWPQVSLIIGSWHETQGFRQATYVRELHAETPFTRISPSGEVFNEVWDLEPLWYERRSWTRYLLSSRQNNRESSYLSQFLAGAV